MRGRVHVPIWHETVDGQRDDCARAAGAAGVEVTALYDHAIGNTVIDHVLIEMAFAARRASTVRRHRRAIRCRRPVSMKGRMVMFFIRSMVSRLYARLKPSESLTAGSRRFSASTMYAEA